MVPDKPIKSLKDNITDSLVILLIIAGFVFIPYLLGFAIMSVLRSPYLLDLVVTWLAGGIAILIGFFVIIELGQK